MNYMSKQDGTEAPLEQRRARSPRVGIKDSARRAVLVRLLVLAGAGGVTTLAYATILFYACGPGIDWGGGAVAALVGALLGLGYGLLLVAWRR